MFDFTNAVGNALLDAQTREPIPLAMQHLDLSGRATPAGAFLRVTHRFKCAGDKPLEALYVFMLPRNGTLRRFIVKGDGFEVESKLSPREEARKEYEEGVEAGHLSVLAETSLDGMVTLSIGQVKPGEEVSVILDVVVGVEVQDRKYRFRFPFTLAPNYHAKAVATATPDGGKIELPSDVFGDLILPEWKTDAKGLHKVTFRMGIEAAGILDSVASPSHRVLVRLMDGNTAEVELAGEGDLPNRDLVIDVISREEAPVILADTELVDGGAGTDDPKIPANAPCWSIIVPSSVFPKSTAPKRKICFLMDASRSMYGERLRQAKLALETCFSALSSEDEFGLAAFGSTTEVFDKGTGKATDAVRQQAAKWLAQINTLGGTELGPALGAAVQILGKPGHDIFLLTDGEVFGTGNIIEQCAASRTRIHVLGIGAAAQDRFLSGLARRTGGVSEMVGVSEDVAAKTLKLFNAIRQPIQTGVKALVEMGNGGKTQEHDLGTVYQNQPVIITDNGESGKGLPVKVGFIWGAAPENLAVDLPLRKGTPNGLVALLWAGRQVEDMESTSDFMGEGPGGEAVKQDLKEVSTTYGLASRAMSLSAVVTRFGDRAGETPDQRVVPVGLPEDMVAEGVFGSRSRGIQVSSGGGYPYQPPGYYCMLSMDAGVSSGERSRGIGLRGIGLRGISHTSNLQGKPLGFADRDGECDDLTGYSIQQQNFETSAFGCSADDLLKGFNLMDALAKISSDGGAFPNTRIQHYRVIYTLALALAVLKAEVEGDMSMYVLHLGKMADFLDANAPADLKDTVTTVTERLRAASTALPGDWLEEYERLNKNISDDSIALFLKKVTDALV